MEYDPFVTLQVDEFGMLPTAVDFTLAPGIVAHYTQPVRYTDDYAIMPEVLALDAVNQFCDELNAALDAVEEAEATAVSDKALPALLLVLAVFWTAVWLVFRGLVR